MNIKKDMKETNNITEAQLLLNQEVRVKMGRFAGRTGIVNKVMADGRSLDVTLFGCDKVVFIDVTLVSEIQEPTYFAQGEPDLGPVANSVVQAHR
jgi:transcription antitermination factor NusG